MRTRSGMLDFGPPLTVAAIAFAVGLALWIAISLLGRVPAVTPELPRLVPSVDTQSSPVPGGASPSSPAGPANEPAPSAVPGPGTVPPTTPTGPSGPANVERPPRDYGDMPIDPPIPNRGGRIPAGE